MTNSAAHAADPARMVVIVGVGQVNDRPANPAEGLDSLGLMRAALEAADVDAGGGWLTRLDSLAVVSQLSFPELTNIPDRLAEQIGANPRLREITEQPSGDSPILLLNEAANRIAAGEITVAAVVGGEALRTAAQRAAARAGTAESAQNATRAHSRRVPQTARHRYGLAAPVDVYPLYENAMRSALGQTLAEGQRESGEIWSRFSQVADANPGAWIHRPRTAEEIITPSADNRPLGFPYTKLMVANSSVNQGAGFIVTSLAAARAAGVPEEQLVHVGRGAAAHEADSIFDRDRFDRSISMAVTLRRTLALNGVDPTALDHVELYSCFPCVPKLARRVIDWPVEKPASVFGGLTFGGGPIGNYMSHAVVSMVLALRREGQIGLLFANGGLATHNHAIVVSRSPLAQATLPCDFDCQAEADAARDPVPPFNENYAGPGRIETYTVLYDRDGSARCGIIVGRSVGGERFLAQVPGGDTAAIAFLTDGLADPIGAPGRSAPGADGLNRWEFDAPAG